MPHNYVKQSEPGATKSDVGAATHNIIGRSTYFGLCDLGFGSPELGYASLLEIAAVRLPHGLRIERDRHFIGRFPLTVYAEAARLTGRITEAETLLATIHRARQPALAKITTADPEIPDISPDPGE
jgi:hypothetical protein